MCNLSCYTEGVGWKFEKNPTKLNSSIFKKKKSSPRRHWLENKKESFKLGESLIKNIYLEYVKDSKISVIRKQLFNLL